MCFKKLKTMSVSKAKTNGQKLVQQYTSVIPQVGRLRQEDCLKFQANMG